MCEDVLAREFFERGSTDVAPDLVGCTLVVSCGARVTRARLVETEAYGGLDDPASHAFRGPTPRASIMFGPAGFLYVYLIYGMHWCANVVTGPEGVPGAVLLRAAQIDDGDEVAPRDILRGPGNLTRGLGISGSDNGQDCCAGPGARISLASRPREDREPSISVSKRVGVTHAADRPWRFFVAGHPAVSKPPTSPPAQRDG